MPPFLGLSETPKAVRKRDKEMLCHTLSDDGMLRWNDMGSATYDIYVDETAMGGMDFFFYVSNFILQLTILF